jgi:hypothetical protein
LCTLEVAGTLFSARARMNEANFCGFLGLVEAARGLEFLQLTEGFQHGPMEALFIEAEVDESLGVGLEGTGGQEDRVNVRVPGVEVAGVFEVPLGEHSVLNGADAVDAPLIVGDGLRELALDWSSGGEAVDDFL